MKTITSMIAAASILAVSSIAAQAGDGCRVMSKTGNVFCKVQGVSTKVTNPTKIERIMSSRALLLAEKAQRKAKRAANPIPYTATAQSSS